MWPNVLINTDKKIPKIKSYFKSTRPEVFYRVAALQNFAKFTGNTCNGELFLAKFHAWTYKTLFKLDSNCWCFPTNFPKLFRTVFLIEHHLHLQVLFSRARAKNCTCRLLSGKPVSVSEGWYSQEISCALKNDKFWEFKL